jgi:ABC-type nitrate/sulfonate/bicarbonate transport system permease component
MPIVLLLLLWELVSRLNLVNPPAFFPPFSEIIFTFFKLLLTSTLLQDLGFTLYRSLIGLTLASLLAIPLGILIGYSKYIHKILNPLVEMLRPLPPAAIIPIAILFLGIFDTMKIAVITFGCIWPVLVNTIAGVHSLDNVLIETGRVFNLTKGQFLWEIVTKGASPYIFTGVRISLAISLILAIMTEMIAGSNGLGFFILLSERSFNFKEMYAGIVTIAILGFLLNKGFTLIVNGHLMKWYQGYTAKI